jgi:hypothetical protein
MRAWTVPLWAALLCAGAILPAPAWAQAELLPPAGWPPAFACDAGTAGQLSVQANVQCGCRWFAASDMRGTPAGYRWDCGILRARTNHEVPESANPYAYPLPEALSLEGVLLPGDPGHR